MIKIPRISFSSIGLAAIGAAIVMLIAGIIYYVQQEHQRVAIEDQTSKTNQLIEEVKRISQDNKNLNEQNRNYAFCNAILLARYTQTNQPIVIEDLNRCILSAFPQASSQSNNSVSSAPQTPTQNRSVTTQPNNTTQPGVSTPVVPSSPTPSVESVPSNQLLSIPGITEINTPCINVLQLVTTC